MFEPYAFAGIMSYNKTLDMRSFAIVTLAPSPNIAEINNRMPVILQDDALSRDARRCNGLGQPVFGLCDPECCF